MKKRVFGVSLVLAALGFLLFPTLAAAAGPRHRAPGPPTLNDFLASLAKPGTTTPAAKQPAAGPAVQGKSLCTATANCRYGGTVYCEGNSSCSAADGDCSWNNVGYVVCDGQSYSCPGSCCPEGFCTRDWQCAWGCNPCNYSYTCNYQYCFDDCECNYSTCPI